MSSCSTAGPQFGDMKSSNFLMLPYVTTEKRRLRSCVKRVHSYAHVILVEGASVALPLPAAGCWCGRLKDVRAARRSETLWDGAIKNRLVLGRPSVRPLQRHNFRSTTGTLLWSFASAVRRFSLITELMFLVDQPRISFYLRLACKGSRKFPRRET